MRAQFAENRNTNSAKQAGFPPVGRVVGYRPFHKIRNSNNKNNNENKQFQEDKKNHLY